MIEIIEDNGTLEFTFKIRIEKAEFFANQYTTTLVRADGSERKYRHFAKSKFDALENGIYMLTQESRDTLERLQEE